MKDYLKRPKTYLIITIILLSLTTISISKANSDFLYNKEKIKTNVEVSSSIEIDGDIKELESNLLFFPRESKNQEIVTTQTKPEAEISDEEIKFNWENPTEEVSFSLNREVITNQKLKKINNKIKFPITKELPEEVKKYTKPSETINSDKRIIKRKANEIVEGETDLMVALFKLSTWVEENIEYNLTTIDADVSKRADWVLRNRVGVCDEMTSLFIAFSRSVGIPARFVSGMSYTTAPYFERNWLGHGWAEVYIPEHGWVSYDPTFGEFGYVDATHIVMQKGVDPNKSANEYRWRGEGKIKLSSLENNVEVIEKGKEDVKKIETEINPISDEVAFESHNAIEIKLKNKINGYIATSITLSAPSEFSIDKKKKHILLEPNQNKSIFFTGKISSNLEKGYTYTLPIAARDEKNNTYKTKFKVSKEGKEITESEIEKLQEVNDKTNTVKNNVSFKCNIENKDIYLGQESKLRCEITNNGNSFISDTSFCISNDCSKITLSISEKEIIEKTIKPSEKGKNKLEIKLNNNEMNKVKELNYTVLDTPKIKVETENKQDKNKLEIKLKLNKISDSIPQNVKITSVSDEGRKKNKSLKILENNKTLSIKYGKTELKQGKNNFKINIIWEDKNQFKYEEKINRTIKIKNSSIINKIINFIYNFKENIF